MADREKPKERAKPTDGIFKRAVSEAEKLSGTNAVVEEGLVLFQYPDCETYKAVQTAGNKAKLGRQFVKENHIALLATYLDAELPEIGFGLCHGTRRGAEQGWFVKHLRGAPEVIGSEISDTASRFPRTFQWDFHEINPDWSGRRDFVYSNSWGHAYGPVKAFGAWIDALRPRGRLLLDKTKGQSPDASNALDPFGITHERFSALKDDNFGVSAGRLPALDYRKTNPEYRARVVVVERNG